MKNEPMQIRMEDDSEGERVTEEPAQPRDYETEPITEEEADGMVGGVTDISRGPVPTDSLGQPMGEVIVPVPIEPKPTAVVIAAPPEEEAPTVETPEAFLAMALRGNYPPETIEKFLNMRKELKAEWAQERYYTALAKFQAICPEIPKTKAVYNKPKGNEAPTVRYWYAPFPVIIKTVKETLKKCGFSYTIHPVEETPEHVIAKVVAHHKDGHREESSFKCPIDSEAYMTAPQKIASARTFAKRNAFCDVFGIVTMDDDDDANMLEDIDAMMKYSEKIEEIEKQTDMILLKKLSRKFYDALDKDEAGQKIILAVFNRKKTALAAEDAAVRKEEEDAAR